MQKQHCPNCNSTDYHRSWSHHQPRCNFCGYDNAFPDRTPPIPRPLPKVQCPQCGSTRLMRYSTHGIFSDDEIWRNLCKQCGYDYDPVQAAKGQMEGKCSTQESR
jgi:uncharacterized protein (DUF983 family)